MTSRIFAIPVRYITQRSNPRPNPANRGPVSEQLGIGGSPALAEDSMVARDCMIALHTGADVDIQHISSRNAVQMVGLAKKLGAHVWAEVTPHHFTLDETAVLEYGTLAKMNPPLRSAADREALIEAIKDGTIDMIATDHAPHSAEEKAKPLIEAPSGIIGLETSLPLAVTRLVKAGHIDYLTLFEKMCLNPAKLYRMKEAGRIREGGAADLVLFDNQIRRAALTNRPPLRTARQFRHIFSKQIIINVTSFFTSLGNPRWPVSSRIIQLARGFVSSCVPSLIALNKQPHNAPLPAASS